MEPTVIQGVNTAGTVRINNLAAIELWLNQAVIAGQVIFFCWGLFIVIQTLRKPAPPGRKKYAHYAGGLALMALGLLIPGAVNFLTPSGCGAVLFH